MTYGKLVIGLPVTGWNLRGDVPFSKLVQIAAFPNVAEEEAQRIVDMHASAARETRLSETPMGYQYSFAAHPVWLQPGSPPLRMVDAVPSRKERKS